MSTTTAEIYEGQNGQKPRPPLSQIIIYAIGQFGWSLAAFGADNLLIYFYMPPESGERQITEIFIHQGALFGVVAVLGLINFSSRIFDAITDPMIANFSDKSQAKMGKRKRMMGFAALPFAILSVLIFYPFTTSIQSNTIVLTLLVFLFYFFMTVYVVPYTALISELGHHAADRMKISTIISVTWALGFIIGNSAYALQELFEKIGLTSVAAFQIAMVIFGVISFIAMMIPVFFLDEKKYCLQKTNTSPIANSVKSSFQNLNFRYLLISDLMYWTALTFIQLGVGYYVTVLMQLDKSFASLFGLIGFFLSFLLYPLVNIWVKKKGKKSILLVGFLFFAFIFLLTFLLSFIALPKLAMFYILAVLSAFPMAAFGIVPNAIIADIIYEHEAKTGQQQAGMFYAIRAFVMKLGKSLSNLIFPSLLLLGKSVENPTGIWMSALCALGFCILGYLVFLKFQDVEIQA